jgi:hypothetical protein
MYIIDFEKQFLSNQNFTKEYLIVTNNNLVKYKTLLKKYQQLMDNYVINEQDKKFYLKWSTIPVSDVKNQIKILITEQREHYNNALSLSLLNYK